MTSFSIYLFTVIVCGLCYYWYQRKCQFWNTATRTCGVVETVDYQTDRKIHISWSKNGSCDQQNQIKFISRINFEDRNGDKHSFIHTSQGMMSSFVVGQKVNLIYHPKNLDHVYLVREYWIGFIIFSVFCSLCLGVSVLIYFDIIHIVEEKTITSAY